MREMRRYESETCKKYARERDRITAREKHVREIHTEHAHI